MSVTAAVVGAGAVVLATLAAAADGALLGGDPEPEASPPVVGVLRRREHAHRALALSRVLAHLVAGAALASAVGLQGSDGWRGVLTAVAMALAVVIVVEGVGRSLGFATAPRFAVAFAPLIRVLEVVLAPVLKAGVALDALFERLMPPPTIEERAEQRVEAAEQFRQVVAAEADVSRDEEALLHGVFSLAQTSVHEVMVPRVDIVGIDLTTRWSEVVDRVRSSEHARFPVYEDTLDDLVGILYAKDLLPFVIDDDEPMMGWQSLVRPASFIPTSKPIDAQLRDFKASHTHIAIVSDEFGGTAGLVTIEDVLEEIVGEIHDEYDDEEPEVEHEEHRRFWVTGRLALDELSELLGQDFVREDLATVGGLVYETFGRVPRPGEAVQVGRYKMVVERVRRRRIERVYFERNEAAIGSALE
ncbi:MAG: transporter-associated region [Gemmatimonadetes bacterium]|jgi:CBS domain containing-hemolysin-like protein|nr:transporter-associated region [Gemmatimonadota bacterium]